MKTQKGVSIPDDFAQVLANHSQLLAVLERMRPSCQQEYVDWIMQSKEQDIRTRRINSVLAKITDWGERHQLLSV